MQGHSLIVLWWAAHAIVPLPSLSNENGHDIDEPCNSSKDGIYNRAICRVVSQLETETTIDDAKGDDDATKPDMSMRNRCSRLELLVVGVVEGTQDWLEKREDEEEDTDDGMGLIDVFHLVSDVHAQAKPNDKEQISQSLARSVEGDQTRKAK